VEAWLTFERLKPPPLILLNHGVWLPEPDEIQIPPTEKQPLVKLIPLENVELAVVEVTESVPVCNPPAKVEVAEVVAVKNADTVSPTTESLAYGVVVPMPTLPEIYVPPITSSLARDVVADPPNNT
jgi:hypothetical protein